MEELTKTMQLLFSRRRQAIRKWLPPSRRIPHGRDLARHTNTAQQHRMEMLAGRCAHDTDVTAAPHTCALKLIWIEHRVYLCSLPEKLDLMFQTLLVSRYNLAGSFSHCFHKFKSCFIFGFCIPCVHYSVCTAFKKRCRCLYFCFFVCMHVVYCVDAWELRTKEVPLIFDQ